MNFKKIMTALLSTLLLAGLLAGCDNSKEDAATEAPAESATVTAIPEGLAVLEESLAAEQFGIGFRKNDELCKQVDAALKVLKANGTMESISVNWFGEDITTTVADATALDGIEAKERDFRLGLDDSFPPMGYKDPAGGNVVGFDIDLAQAVCDLMNWNLMLQSIDWSAKEMELESGNIDCIWNGMTLTQERKESMSCSEPYMENEQVLVVMAGSGYKSLSDLENKSLSLQSGSSAEDALNGAESFKASLGNVSTFANNLECFMDLEQGGVDAVLVDSIVANWYITTGDIG